VDENVGIPVTISGSMEESNVRDISGLSLRECRVKGPLGENFRLPSFKHPNLLQKISLEGSIRSGNLKKSISFSGLKAFRLSLGTLETLKISELDINLPQLESLEIVMEEKFEFSQESVTDLGKNLRTLLHGKGLGKLRKLHFHCWCWMKSVDAEIRDGIFQLLLNHKDSVEDVDIHLVLSPDSPELVDDELREAISRQTTLNFDQMSPFPALKDFSFILGSVPLNEEDYFGVQWISWSPLVNHLHSLESYELNCMDEEWEESCVYEDNVPYEYIPNKPPLPKDLIMRNSSHLRKLTLSIKTWDDGDEIPELLDFSVFESCLNLEELSLVGQWIRDLTGFIEALDSELAVVDNISKLPGSLRVFKSSCILLHPDDVMHLVGKKLEELQLKYFGPHGACHILRGESITATTFIGKFTQTPFICKAIHEGAAFVTRIELVASDYLARVGEDRATLLDAYVLRNCVHLKDFSLEGMTFDAHYNELGEEEPDGLVSSWLKQEIVLPAGINRIAFFPRSVQYLTLKKVFLKSHHLNFFANELADLRTLHLQTIGQFQNCGVTPKFVREICLRRRLERLKVSEGLNWRSWKRFDDDVGEEAYPLLTTISKTLTGNLALTLKQSEDNYLVKLK